MFRPSLALFTLAVACESVLACIPPPPAVQLPDEPDDVYQMRAQHFSRVREDEGRRQYQASLYDKASRISLARVSNSRAIDASGLPGHEIEVQLVASLRGEPQPAVMTLADRYMTTCGPVGGGSATASPPGAFIIVFEGDLIGTDQAEPVGIPLFELRETRTIAAIDQAVLRLPDGSGTPKL